MGRQDCGSVNVLMGTVPMWLCVMVTWLCVMGTCGSNAGALPGRTDMVQPAAQLAAAIAGRAVLVGSLIQSAG
jgi:hypothetical protein